MKKISKILLNSFPIAILAIAPFNIVSCGVKANITCAEPQKETAAGEKTVDFVFTITGPKSLNDITAEAEFSSDYQKVECGNLSINGNNVTVPVTITPKGAALGCFTLFKIKFSGNRWKQTSSELKITYKPIATKDIPSQYLNIESNTLKGISSGYESDCTTLNIPSTVTKVAANACKDAFKKNNGGIEIIKIPNSVVEIEDNAFDGCDSIASLDLSGWTSTPNWSGKDIFKNWSSSGVINTNGTYKTLVLDGIYDKLPGAWSYDEYMETYIMDRTFSIRANNGSYQVFGTGWIFNDATPNVKNDYEYYIATNWHVIHGFEDLGGSIKYTFADDSLKNSGHKCISYNNYIKFGTFTPMDTTDFLYDVQHGPYFIKGIDFYVAKVKFDSGTLTNSIKTKLNKLNNKFNKDGYITKTETAAEQVSNTRKWIGGYPYHKDSTQAGGQWENHKLDIGSLIYKPFSELNIPGKTHSIGYPDKDTSGSPISYPEGITPEQFYYYDIAPQLFYNKEDLTDDWMSGGASGSMLVNENYEVAGIYWGGWGYSGSNVFFPSFSQFNSTTKNFIAKFL